MNAARFHHEFKCDWRIIALIVGLLGVVTATWYYKSRCDYLFAEVQYLRVDEISDERMYVGITGGVISYIGKEPVRAKKIIQGRGLILSPGLIDVNTCGWLSESAAVLKLKDGITTFFNAHGDSFEANPKVIGASEKLNYATSVSLIPAYANHLTGAKMMEALENSLRYGAYTISLSPEYTKETTPEIIAELSRHFSNKNVLFSFHLRHSSSEMELEGLKEAIDCAALGNSVQILHITSTGATYHPEEAMRMIDGAVLKGMRITYDFYPYTAWASSNLRARFDGNWQERYQVNFSKVQILGESNLTPERFEELRMARQERMVIVESIPRSTVDYFATNTSCPLGTDSEAKHDTTHPRGAGSFTKFFNDYVDTGKMDFAKALHRFSTATARMFAVHIPDLTNRGVIQVGYAADLVLWNRAEIKSRASFANPLEPSMGVVAAFVNGVPQILDGEPVEVKVPSGRHLKGVWAR